MREAQGSAIKKLCTARGIRFSWLAAQIGVSQSMFGHIEAGRKNPPPGYYERAAVALGVPLDWVKPEPEAVPA